MAVTEQPILIKYNGNDYDFRTLKERVSDNYEKYARQFGYSKNKSDKDWQGLTEILLQLQQGNATVEPDQILFNNSWGNEKGTFGKVRNKSRHYRNPTWMIINTLRDMEKYDPNAGKKKINESTLNSELSTALSRIDTGLKNEGNKLSEQIRVINELKNKYINPSNDYVIEDGFDLQTYISKLDEVIKALGTKDEGVDDELAFFKLGIDRPIQEKPLTGFDAYLKGVRDNGFSEVDVPDAEVRRVYNQMMKKRWEDFKNQELGITPSTTSETSSSKSSTVSSGSQDKSAVGVVAGVSGGQKETKEDTKKETKEGTKVENKTQPETKKEIKTGNGGTQGGEKNYKTANDVIKGENLSHRTYFNFDGKLYWVNKNRAAVNVGASSKGYRTYDSKGIAKSRNGSKLQTLVKLKKYKVGDQIESTPDGSDDEPQNPRDSTTNQAVDYASIFLVLFGGGKTGKAALGLQGLVQAVKLYKAYQAMQRGEIPEHTFDLELIHSLSLFVTQGVGELSPYLRKLQLKAKSNSLNKKMGEITPTVEEAKKLDTAAKQASQKVEARKTEIQAKLKEEELNEAEKANLNEELTKLNDKSYATKEMNAYNQFMSENNSKIEKYRALYDEKMPYLQELKKLYDNRVPYWWTYPTGAAVDFGLTTVRSDGYESDPYRIRQQLAPYLVGFGKNIWQIGNAKGWFKLGDVQLPQNVFEGMPTTKPGAYLEISSAATTGEGLGAAAEEGAAGEEIILGSSAGVADKSGMLKRLRTSVGNSWNKVKDFFNGAAKGPSTAFIPVTAGLSAVYNKAQGEPYRFDQYYPTVRSWDYDQSKGVYGGYGSLNEMFNAYEQTHPENNQFTDMIQNSYDNMWGPYSHLIEDSYNRIYGNYAYDARDKYGQHTNAYTGLYTDTPEYLGSGTYTGGYTDASKFGGFMQPAVRLEDGTIVGTVPELDDVVVNGNYNTNLTSDPIYRAATIAEKGINGFNTVMDYKPKFPIAVSYTGTQQVPNLQSGYVESPISVGDAVIGGTMAYQGAKTLGPVVANPLGVGGLALLPAAWKFVTESPKWIAKQVNKGIGGSKEVEEMLDKPLSEQFTYILMNMRKKK